MKKINLNAEMRYTFGKSGARKLRRSGLIPAVFYGRKMEPVSLRLSILDLKKAISGERQESVLIGLTFKAGEETKDHMVMLKELQTHPVSGNFIHADFYEVAMDEKIVTTVSVHFVGKAKGVEVGGIMRQIKREVEVEALPAQIPSYIEVGISHLEIGDLIHVSDLKSEEGVEILEESNLTLLTILPPTVAKEEEEEEGGEEEGEGKKEDGEETPVDTGKKD